MSRAKRVKAMTPKKRRTPVPRTKKQPKRWRKVFYHITAVGNIDSILAEGLRGGCNPRYRGGGPLAKASVFVVTHDSNNLFDAIATCQIWINQDIDAYAIMEIDSVGIAGKIRSDNVAEKTAGFHRIIEQDVIAPSFVRLGRVRQLNYR